MAAPLRLQTLAEIDAALWRELARAPLDRHHEWRTPVLATAEKEGADARTVVLRESDAQARTLRLYTDVRSAKVAQMARQPLGTLVMWSRRLGWQLRVRVHLGVHSEGPDVASRWARVSQSPAAQDYLSPLAPGTALSADLDHAAPGSGSAEAQAPGRAVPERGHFAVVVAQVVHIDWLELHAQGHRRAFFDASGGRWLVP